MKEILFRAKRLEDGKWVEGFYYKINETTYAFADDYEKNPVPTHHYILFERMTDWGLPNQMYQVEVDGKTVCQYTGLNDKNGKKIFENDILKISYTDGQENYTEITEVNFEEKSASFSPWNWEYDCDGCDLYCHIEEIEIIGNIFDYPELLENWKTEESDGE